MEILWTTFGGISVTLWLVIFALAYGAYELWNDLAEKRQIKRDQLGKERFARDHQWQRKMVGGVDHGEWVRKDGQPIRGSDDDWKKGH